MRKFIVILGVVISSCSESSDDSEDTPEVTLTIPADNNIAGSGSISDNNNPVIASADIPVAGSNTPAPTNNQPIAGSSSNRGAAGNSSSNNGQAGSGKPEVITVRVYNDPPGTAGQPAPAPVAGNTAPIAQEEPSAGSGGTVSMPATETSGVGGVTPTMPVEEDSGVPDDTGTQEPESPPAPSEPDAGTECEMVYMGIPCGGWHCADYVCDFDPNNTAPVDDPATWSNANCEQKTTQCESGEGMPVCDKFGHLRVTVCPPPIKNMQPGVPPDDVDAGM